MAYPIGKIFSERRKQIKMKQDELSKRLETHNCSVKKSAISSWETGGSFPNAVQFLATCEILGITDIYETFVGINPNNPMSELNEEGQAKVMDYITLLIQSGQYQKQVAEVIPFTRTIRLFHIPASAGTGEFLDSDDYEEISVGNEVPASADFGIHINGDSMEPQFVHGQVVWVEQTQELSSGEIGIFFLDGNAYCKKLHITEHGTYLVSLNPKYEPITITEAATFHAFGKVVG